MLQQAKDEIATKKGAYTTYRTWWQQLSQADRVKLDKWYVDKFC